jgi:hypothetical protein
MLMNAVPTINGLIMYQQICAQAEITGVNAVLWQYPQMNGSVLFIRGGSFGEDLSFHRG